MNISVLALICGAVCSCGCGRGEKATKKDPVAVEKPRMVAQTNDERLVFYQRRSDRPGVRPRYYVFSRMDTNEVVLIKRRLTALAETKFDGMTYEQQDRCIREIKEAFSHAVNSQLRPSNAVSDDYIDIQIQYIQWLDKQKARIDAEAQNEELLQLPFFSQDLLTFKRLRRSLTTGCYISRIDLELIRETIASWQPYDCLPESEDRHIRERVEAFLGRPIRSRAELKEARKCIPPPSEVVKRKESKR